MDEKKERKEQIENEKREQKERRENERREKKEQKENERREKKEQKENERREKKEQKENKAREKKEQKENRIREKKEQKESRIKEKKEQKESKIKEKKEQKESRIKEKDERKDKNGKKEKTKKNKHMPVKRTMNLYYKPDRTTKPATVALYVLFVLVVAAGLSKVMFYDMWVKVENARMALWEVEGRLNSLMAELTDYDEIKTKYQRYSATDEERAQIDRMEIVGLLDEAVGGLAQMRSYSVSGTQVSVQIDQVTLAQAAEMVRLLDESPLVGRTVVNTASTTTSDQDGDQDGTAEFVSASILIELVKEGETNEETTVSP